MILSMTGFGRGTASSSSKKITVDIKSLNSKQLDLMMRVPACLKDVELEARGRVAARLERGKVEMNVTCETVGTDSPLHVNVELMAAYKSQILDMATRLGLPEPADWYATLLRMPDAMKSDSGETDPADADAFLRAASEAADALVEFRVAEGRKLYGFFVEKISNITSLLGQIGQFEEERVPRVKARLEEQLSRLTSIEYDRGRLEQELIFYIEKLDVTEEKTRLRAHMNYFLETMGPADGDLPTQGQGKKLGFIAQEMGREINTLGSKSNQAEMQRIVVKMKDELEQIKEQVLNVL